MQLDITKALQSPGVEFPFQAEIEMAEQWFGGERIEFNGPATITGIYASAGESVFIRGRMQASLNAACAKCLAPVTYGIDAGVDETFVRTPDPESPEAPIYAGTAIDLAELGLTALVLALPMRFLCKSDCEGLCPICGADLNETTCPCQKELPSQHPLSALQQLLIKDEEV